MISLVLQPASVLSHCATTFQIKDHHPCWQTTQETTQNPTQETTQDPTQETTQDPTQETTQLMSQRNEKSH